MFECYPIMETIEENGGYTTLGDGLGNKRIVLKNGAIEIELNEEEIIKLRSAIGFFDPRVT